MTIADFSENSIIQSTQSGCLYKVIKIAFEVTRGKKKPEKSFYSIIESENGKHKSKIYHSQKDNYWQLCAK